MSYVLGIDGGGSNTTCVLLDSKRQLLGRGEAGPSNYQTVGIAATLESILAAIQAAVTTTNDVKISAICLGLAGIGRKADAEVLRDTVDELQNSKSLPITWDLQPANILICSDALVSLVGGIGGDVGIVVAVGTGSIVFGRNHQGQIKRIGGWGYILGDEGSAYKIATSGMQAALKYHDGLGMFTRLVEDFQQHLDLANIEDLVGVIYRQGWGVKEIASLAPIVDFAAADGDLVANQIIDHNIQELVAATSLVIPALFGSDPDIEVVTTGNVWWSKSNMFDRFATSLVKDHPSVKVIRPRHEPAYGAGLLALQSLGVEIN
jgi:N-acetylglucosamine kinase